MDKLASVLNSFKTFLSLIGLIVAGAVYVYSLDTRIAQNSKKVEEFVQDQKEIRRRLRRMEQNVIRLGERWNVPMELPPDWDDKN